MVVPQTGKPLKGFGGQGWWAPSVLSEDGPARCVEEISGVSWQMQGSSAGVQGLMGHGPVPEGLLKKGGVGTRGVGQAVCRPDVRRSQKDTRKRAGEWGQTLAKSGESFGANLRRDGRFLSK